MKFTISLIIVLFSTVGLVAQQPPPTPTPAKPLVQRRCCGQRFPKRVVTGTPTPQPTQAAPDFFVGDAKVDVTKDEAVVRLAMAQHGSVLIELPANDGPRYIIPGDPEMATVDEKALERNKRAIVVRPGTQFVPPRHNVKAINPAATVTAQMRSGLVVTFLFYPVEDLAQNVHRCVLNYNRDEVVARRSAAGLPVNLDDKEQGGEKLTAQSTAAPTSTEAEKSKGNKPDQQGPPARNDSSLPSETNLKEEKESPTNSVVTPILSSAPTNNSDLVASLRSALDQGTKRPKQFKHWTKTTHGLKLSILEDANTGKPFKVLTLAVKNTTSASLNLVANSPELFVETVDEQGTTVNVHSIAKTQTETSDASAVIAGATAY